MLRKALKSGAFTKRKTLPTGVRLLYWPRTPRHLRHVHFLLMPRQPLKGSHPRKKSVFFRTLSILPLPPPPLYFWTPARKFFKTSFQRRKKVPQCVWILDNLPILHWKCPIKRKISSSKCLDIGAPPLP